MVGNRLCTYKDIRGFQYEGVTVKQFFAASADKATRTVISLVPTPEEIEAAPKAVSSVLRDIGVTPSDRVSLSLAICPSLWSNNFEWQARPEEITDDRIGISLSTFNYGGEIIAHVVNTFGDPEVETYQRVQEVSLFERRGDTIGIRILGQRAPDVREAYRKSGVNVDGNGPEYMAHPYKNKILTKAVKWTADLIDKRRKADV